MLDHWWSSINLIGFKLILPPIINYRRKEEYRHVAKRVEDIFDQEMSGESIQNIFEKEDEGDEGWIDRYDISKIYD
jgi:hypothetical protein